MHPATMVLTCSQCGAEHVHPYVYCQECEAVMNPLVGYDGPTLQVPLHFRRANEGGYTMAELRRENDAGFRQQERAGQL